ncbi:MAG: IS66 family transposase [Halobacteriota archaeon]
MCYALGNWNALVRYAADGRPEIDNNRAESAACCKHSFL